MQRIMIVAGGEWQVPLIKKAKEMGAVVINSNLYKNSPGFRYADYCEVADVLDKEANLRIAKKYHIDAVLTDESDIAVPTTAYIAEKLGIPGIGMAHARLFTNKYLMRRFCTGIAFPCPEFAYCQNAGQVRQFMKELGRKVILKPLDAQSSRGVYILQKESDAEKYFEQSVQYSQSARAIVAERYIDGVEFTVDGMIVNGQHHCLAVSEKKHFSYNRSIASELYFAHENPKYDYQMLCEMNDTLISRSGLSMGLTHAEYKYENGIFYLIEAAARGGGTRISSHIVPKITGIDTYGFLIRSALGEKREQDCLIKGKYKSRCVVLKFLELEAGVVELIKGEDEVRNHPNIMELRLEFSVGDMVERAKDDRSRAGFYIAYGDTKEQLAEIMAWVDKTLRIVYR